MSPTPKNDPFITLEQLPSSKHAPVWMVKTHKGAFRIGWNPIYVDNSSLEEEEVKRIRKAVEALPHSSYLPDQPALREIEDIIADHFEMVRGPGGSFVPRQANADRARLDADGTAKPKTRIVHHPNIGDCQGPGMMLKNPEFEKEDGTRIPLKGTPEEMAQPATIYSANNGKGYVSLFVHERDAIQSILTSLGADGKQTPNSSVHPLQVWPSFASWKADQTRREKDAIISQALSKLTPEERMALGFSPQE